MSTCTERRNPPAGLPRRNGISNPEISKQKKEPVFEIWNCHTGMNWNFATLTRKRVFLASLTNKETLGRKEVLGKLFDFRTYLDFTPTLHSTFFDAGVTKAKEKLLSTALLE